MPRTWLFARLVLVLTPALAASGCARSVRSLVIAAPARRAPRAVESVALAPAPAPAETARAPVCVPGRWRDGGAELEFAPEGADPCFAVLPGHVRVAPRPPHDVAWVREHLERFFVSVGPQGHRRCARISSLHQGRGTTFVSDPSYEFNRSNSAQAQWYRWTWGAGVAMRHFGWLALRNHAVIHGDEAYQVMVQIGSPWQQYRLDKSQRWRQGALSRCEYEYTVVAMGEDRLEVVPSYGAVASYDPSATMSWYFTSESCRANLPSAHGEADFGGCAELPAAD